MNSKKFCALCGTRVILRVAFEENQKMTPSTTRATTAEFVMKLKNGIFCTSSAAELLTLAISGCREAEVVKRCGMAKESVAGWVRRDRLNIPSGVSRKMNL